MKLLPYKKTVVAAISVCLFLMGCSHVTTITNTVSLETTDANMNEYTWIDDEIGDFRKITLREALHFIDEKGSGILYFGHVGCPWCERAVPILNEVALETKATIYYVNTEDSYDEDDFVTLKNDLYDALPVDSNGTRDFYVPMVVGIKKGMVTGHHTSLVGNFRITSSDVQMSDEQKKNLKNLYEDIVKKTED